MGLGVITFEPTTHSYRLNGRPVPSVTQVLKAAGLIDRQWYTEEACRLGSLVAEATALHDRGELDEATLDPAIRPYLDGWNRFLVDSGAEVILAEEPAANEVYGYAGTYDRWLKWEGLDWLIDIKTGACEPFHALQTAAYAACIGTPMQRACIHLDGDGGYRVNRHIDPNDEAVFKAALAITKWKETHK